VWTEVADKYIIIDKKDSSGCVEYSKLQIVHNLDFKRSLNFFNVKYVKNSTRQSYIYNGKMIESCVCLLSDAVFNDLEWLLIQRHAIIRVV